MPSAQQNQRLSRYWLFTLNEGSINSIDCWKTLQGGKDLLQGIERVQRAPIQYAVWQVENAPTTNRHHIQGYIEFKDRRRFGQVKGFFSSGIHIEARKGTAQQARDYCMKEDTRLLGPFEFKEFNNFDKKSSEEKFGDIIEMCKQQTSLEEIRDKYKGLWFKYSRVIKELQQEYAIDRDLSKIQLTVIYGPSQVGKTTFAQECWPDAYLKKNLDNFWQFYDGEKVVFFDEFSGSYPYSELLQLTGKSKKLILNIKGSAAKCKAEHIVIISNSRPSEWYSCEYSKHGQLLKRITMFIHVPELGKQYYMSYQEAVLLAIG